MNTELSSARAPDPESLGKIRHIVASAHKWGGNGSEPKFRKIRQVLLRKHPEVIARAFGGNANVAAAWIKNNWYRMRGMESPSTRKKDGKVRMALSNQFQEVPREFFEGGHELFSAGYEPEREGNLIWVTAMREGEWKVNPIPGKRGPLVLDREFMEDVMRAWREGAWEFVTVPTYHTDQDVLANTGYVRDLRITPDPARPGRSLLRAALEFTEPEVAEKVLRGSIAGVSVNVKFNVRHQETGKMYNKVLTHIALTNMPFINGLRAFERRLAASSEDISEDEVLVSYQLDEEDSTWLALADVAWDPERDMLYVKQQIEAQLNHFGMDDEGELYDMSDPMAGHTETDVDEEGEEDDAPDQLTPARVFIVGMTDETVLLCAHAARDGEIPMLDVQDRNGECIGWVAGYSLEDDGEVVLDPLDEWVAVRKAWMEMSREFTLTSALPISSEEVVDTTDDLALRAFSEEERDRLARSGKALPDGSYPIVTVGDLRNAVAAFGRAKNKAAAKRHIIKRARALGRTDLLPEEWSATLESEEEEEMSATTTTDESPRGGDGMADGNSNEETQETTEESTSTTEMAAFSREDLDRIADERAQAALDAYRQQQEEEQRTRDAELAAAREQLHEMAVKERIAELEARGHAPTVVKAAREIMLADVRHEPVLSLTREDGEVSLSATDIVSEILSSIPETALTKSEFIVAPGKATSNGSESVEARAERIISFVKGE